MLTAALLALAFLQQPAAQEQAVPSSAEEQAQRIAAVVESMAPSTPGVASVYFLGFAGYGEQRVFRKEAELARQVFADRFGSGARSIELINDVHDRTTYPLATLDNLRHALRGIGDRMNRDTDILVVVLTSHGSARYGIAITNGKLEDEDLSPRDLRRALDDAGIRWRIVVASACYAGIFIDPLKTDATLIITAADARHSSFGCADDRDLTYFGEALLKDSLPGSCSIQQAFAQADRLVRRRESDEGDTHSNPQIYIGQRMRAKLGDLDRVRGCHT